MRKRFAGSVAVRVSWFLTICREGVLLADIYDPNLNPLYQHVLLHYGVVAMPCRIKDPDRKGKWSRVSDTLKKHRSRDCASRA